MPTPARAREQLIAICISTALVMAGQGVVSPVLPLFAQTFQVSTWLIGATVTSFGLARMVTNIPAGSFADRHGRRWLLIGGPVVTCVGMAASGLAPSIWLLLAARFVAGLGSALYMTGAQIYLLDIAAPDQRGRFIATNQAALLAGISLGPALGGLLADRFGLPAPFLFVAASAALTAVYGWFRLAETLRPTDRPGSGDAGGPAGFAGSANGWSVFVSRNFLAVALVTLGVFSIRAGVRQTLIPLQLTEAFGLAVDELGLLFTALGVLGLVLIWPAGWAADRLGPKAVIVPTALAVSVGMGIVALAPTLTVFVGGLTLSTIGSSITGPAPAAFVASLVEEDQRGRAMGLYRTFGDAGVVASPVLSGYLADLTSLPFAIGANALGMGLAAIAFLLLVDDSARSAAAVAPDSAKPEKPQLDRDRPPA